MPPASVGHREVAANCSEAALLALRDVRLWAGARSLGSSTRSHTALGSHCQLGYEG